MLIKAVLVGDTMNKLITVIGMVLLSTSCLKLEGTLKVSESLSAIEKYGFLNMKTRLIKITPGTYSAAVSIKSDKNFTLELSKDGDNISIPVKAQNDLNVPDNGKFTISGDQIGQPFNINGTINTESESSSQSNGIESCTKERRKVICERDLNGRDDRRDHEPSHSECREITETYQGDRNVTYHFVTVTRNLELELSKDTSTAVSATFAGIEHDTTKVYDYVGICF